MCPGKRIAIEFRENDWKAIQHVVRLGCGQKGDAWVSWGAKIIEVIQASLDDSSDPNYLLEVAPLHAQVTLEPYRTPHRNMNVNQTFESDDFESDSDDENQWSFSDTPDSHGVYHSLENGDVFVYGEGVMSPDEYRTFRRISDLEDGIDDDD